MFMNLFCAVNRIIAKLLIHQYNGSGRSAIDDVLDLYLKHTIFKYTQQNMEYVCFIIGMKEYYLVAVQ